MRNLTDASTEVVKIFEVNSSEFDEISPYYCDYNATTPLPNSLLDAARESFREHWINLSSPYSTAKDNSKWLRIMRKRFSAFSGTDDANVIFCGSSTEAINQAIYSLSQTHSRIVISDIEHSAVTNAAKIWFKDRVTVISARKLLNHDFSEIVEEFGDLKRSVFFIQAANNEAGVILPITQIRERLQRSELVVDASQIVGKTENFLEIISVADAAVFSPHKFYGPKGVGILIWKNSLGTPATLISGGGQEGGYRSGTENSPALHMTHLWMQLVPGLMNLHSKIDDFRRDFEEHIIDQLPGSFVVGCEFERIGNTSTICFPGLVSESVISALDSNGIMVSSGSACTSGTQEPSRTYLALGLSWEEARSTIRFSFGCGNLKISPIDLSEKVAKVLKRLRT